jgi:hypothetical protein
MRISKLMPQFKMPGTRVRGAFWALNNPDGPEYIVRLVGDVAGWIVVRVSIDTAKIVNSLPTAMLEVATVTDQLRAAQSPTAAGNEQLAIRERLISQARGQFRVATDK